MADHDLYCPPSSAYRWMNCNGSSLRNASPKDEPGEMAIWGTDCHTIMQQYVGYLGTWNDMPTIPEDKREAIDKAVEYLSNVGIAEATKDDTIQTEVQLNLLPLGIEAGSADLIWYQFASKILHVVDYKFGRNFVHIDTPQLLIYGIGASGDYPDAERVIVHIVAPFFYPGYQRKEYTIKELTEAAYRIKMTVEKCHEHLAQLVTGEWCKYCPSSHSCPQLHLTTTALTATEPSSLVTGLQHMIPEERAGWRAKLAAVEAWCEDAKTAFDAAVMDGSLTVPGWGITNGRRTREWADPVAAAKILGNRAFVLATPAQADKLVSKEAVKALVQWKDGKQKVDRIK